MNMLVAYGAAMNMNCTHTCSLQRVPQDATADTERTVIQAELRCTSPIELKNDERERDQMGTVAALHMMWTKLPEAGETIRERDRIIIGTYDFRVLKVKPWPVVDPVYYELHIEDEN